MRISTKGEYGLLAIIDLAMQPGEASVQALQIAERHDIPKQYLDQLMLMLRKAGLIESTRGRQGGYRLARSARNITLLNVVEAMEGPVTNSNFRSSRRKYGANRVLKKIWDGMNDDVVESLRSKTVEDVCRECQSVATALNYEI
jgi:Rrf2 family protein